MEDGGSEVSDDTLLEPVVGDTSGGNGDAPMTEAGGTSGGVGDVPVEEAGDAPGGGGEKYIAISAFPPQADSGAAATFSPFLFSRVGLACVVSVVTHMVNAGNSELALKSFKGNPEQGLNSLQSMLAQASPSLSSSVNEHVETAQENCKTAISNARKAIEAAADVKRAAKAAPKPKTPAKKKQPTTLSDLFFRIKSKIKQACYLPNEQAQAQ